MLSKSRFDQLIKLFTAIFVRGFGSIASLAITIIVGAYFNPKDTGVILLGLSVILFFGQLNTFGSQNSLVRKISCISENLEIKRYLTKIFGFVNLFSIVSCFYVYLFFKLGVSDGSTFSDLVTHTSILLVSVFFYTNVQLIGFTIQALNRPISSSFFQSLLVPSVFVFIFFILKQNSAWLDVKSVFVSYSLATVFAFALGYVFLISKNVNLNFAKGKEGIEFKSSLVPLAIVMTMNLLVNYSSHFISGYFLPPSEVGILVLSQRLSMIVSFILIAINMVIAPRIAKSFHNEDMSSINDICLKARWLMLLFALPLTAVICYFSDELLGAFDQSYGSKGFLLSILAFAQLFNVLTGSVGFLLALTNHERELRNVAIVSGIFATIACFLLTSIFGLAGAALGVFFGVVFQNGLGAVFVWRRLKINVFNYSFVKSI